MALQLSDETNCISNTNSDVTTISRSSSIERFRLPEGYVKEKFKVDRRKLGSMILQCPPDPWDTEVMKIPINSEGRVMSIDEFFENIMERTDTEIKYPKFLEIGAKNKKDPHVHIIGTPESVRQAGQLVCQELQPQLKITMKIDVPWTCHSHIIGKGGGNIQSVVKRTGVSVHFPDGNKNSDINKCNQVSINSRGPQLTGLEGARSAIRELTPLVFAFRLPATAQFIMMHAVNPAVLVNEIQSRYYVQAELSYSNDGAFLLGSVKGIQSDAARVKEATSYMLQSICGPLGEHMPVETTVDISSQHHLFVLGSNALNIQTIMKQTCTRIVFPNPGDGSLSTLKKSTVSIFGGIDNVYSALQKVIGSLPLMLMFDLPPDQTLDDRDIHQTVESFGVKITRPRIRTDGRQSINIKAEERNASLIYQAWRHITQSEETIPPVKIPQNYFIPDISFLHSQGRLHSMYNAPREPVVDYNQNLLSCCQKPPEITETSNNNDSYCQQNHWTDVWKYCNQEPVVDYSEYVDTTQYNNDIEKTLLEAIKAKDNSGDVLNTDYVSTGDDLVNAIYNDRRAPGIERELEHKLTLEYSACKALAAKAMKAPVTGEPRTPTSNWAGWGFSKSTPGFPSNLFSRQKLSGFENWNSGGSPSSSGNSSSDLSNGGISEWPLPRDPSVSNYCESLLVTPKLTNYGKKPTNVASILFDLQLDQYIDMFSSQDVDMALFLSLTDNDLKELGITVFGHRKKLLLAIKNLLIDQENKF